MSRNVSSKNNKNRNRTSMYFHGDAGYIVTVGVHYQRPSRYPVSLPAEDDYGIQPAYCFYEGMRRNRRGYLPYHDSTSSYQTMSSKKTKSSDNSRPDSNAPPVPHTEPISSDTDTASIESCDHPPFTQEPYSPKAPPMNQQPKECYPDTTAVTQQPEADQPETADAGQNIFEKLSVYPPGNLPTESAAAAAATSSGQNLLNTFRRQQPLIVLPHFDYALAITLDGMLYPIGPPFGHRYSLGEIQRVLQCRDIERLPESPLGPNFNDCHWVVNKYRTLEDPPNAALSDINGNVMVIKRPYFDSLC